MAIKEGIQVDPGVWMAARGIPYAPEAIVGWGKDKPFTQEEVEAFAQLMTNLSRPVYAFTDKMPMVVSVAAFARYSRSPRPLRTLVEREFWSDDDNELNEEAAGKIGEKIVMEYGDDSVKQLGTIRVACEMISQLAVKEIEDGRLGAYLEKSSRYVDFGIKVHEKYLYLRPKEIEEAGLQEEYEQVIDGAFDLYKATAAELRIYLANKFPIEEGVDPDVYKASIRAKAFDLARVFLPMSTLTNMGIVMSGQAMEGMLNKMGVSPLDECRTLALEIRREAHQVLPALIPDEARDRYGDAARKYLDESRKRTLAVAGKLLGKMKEDERVLGQKVELISRDEHALNKVVSAILFPHTSTDVSQIEKLVAEMADTDKKELVDAYLAGRSDRRHKPGRAFEEAVYRFQITCKVAEWRDLQRHRMLKQDRQLITMDHGFNTPDEFNHIELDGISVADLYARHMTRRKELFDKVKEQVSPEVAQHVVGFGNYMKWTMTVNLRELYHLIPLRAGKAGHPDYRRIAREMFYPIAQTDPILVLPMEKYIDFSDESVLDRLDQLARVKQKLIALGITSSDTFDVEM